MTLNLDKIKAKIRGLSAKTTGAGCTEAEALAAMAMVGKLLEQYNLSLEETQTITDEPMSTGSYPNQGRNRDRWSFVFVQIAEFTSTRCWNNIATNETRYFGLEPDVLLAVYLHSVLNQAIDTETRRFKRTAEYLDRSPKGRRLASTSFQHGLARRVYERLEPVIPASTTGTALMVVKDQLVTEAFAKLNMKLRSSKAANRRVDTGAFAAGRAAGDRVNFNRPIGNSSSAARSIGA